MRDTDLFQLALGLQGLPASDCAVLYLVLFQLERPRSKKRLAFRGKESLCVDVRGR